MNFAQQAGKPCRRRQNRSSQRLNTMPALLISRFHIRPSEKLVLKTLCFYSFLLPSLFEWAIPVYPYIVLFHCKRSRAVQSIKTVVLCRFLSHLANVFSKRNDSTPAKEHESGFVRSIFCSFRFLIFESIPLHIKEIGAQAPSKKYRI